jgi:hypothetical protein
MVDFYNFLFSWQLFPEKGTYEKGERPKSGNYKIVFREESNDLLISMSWVSLENQAFNSEFSVAIDGSQTSLQQTDGSDSVFLTVNSSTSFDVVFISADVKKLHIRHEITPQALLQITQTHWLDPGQSSTNTELYHKQFSVLPYAASASSAVVKQNEAGLIRHQALTAMEEQTHLQFEQIRRQIELLALQAKEIQKRKDLSMIIYGTKLGFAPVIGHTYYLYKKEDESHLLTMIAPHEWGKKSTSRQEFLAAVKLLADHTWTEMELSNN